MWQIENILPQLGQVSELDNMTQAEIQQVMALLTEAFDFSQPPQIPLTTHDTNITNIMTNGDPWPDPISDTGAFITGRLQAGVGNDGAYSFNVNLGSGVISGGAMSGRYGSGTSYNLSDGTGSVSGNNFNIGGFHGSVIHFGNEHTDVGGSALNGTARYGFDNVGDIGASGTFRILHGNGMFEIHGDIVDGWRVR
jgi:hypothetical protein